MELNKWYGTWENFENYIESEDVNIVNTWGKVEELAYAMPMFKNGVKAFWNSVCYTKNAENDKQIDKLDITVNNDVLSIKWLLKDDCCIFNNYRLESIVHKGLEGKESYLFESDNNNCFKYLLLMEPMPEKGNKELLSHFHFQFASKKEMLVEDDKLVNPAWYATMVDNDALILDKVNLLRALHKLPKIATL